jgi:hypothetical protein
VAYGSSSYKATLKNRIRQRRESIWQQGSLVRSCTSLTESKGSQTVQFGVLILRGGSDLLLWRAVARKGELITMRLRLARKRIFGNGSNRRFGTGSSSPDCGEIPDPPTEGHWLNAITDSTVPKAVS